MMSILWCWLLVNIAWAIEFWPWDETILTEKTEDVVGGDVLNSDDIINDGINAIAWGDIEGIYNEDITDNATAWEKATNLMKWFLNYVLALIGLVALVYLIYHGFLTLTAGNDEERSKKWMQWIKTALIALVWLGVAWFVLSLVFFVIFTVTDGL